MPTIKQQVTQAVEVAQKSMEKVDMKSVSGKVEKAVQTVKKRIESLKKSNTDNDVKININNKEAQKQISQIQKQIDSLQEKINARKIKLDIITPKLNAIQEQPMNKVMPNRLESNKEYIGLADKETQLVEEIKVYTKQLDEAKSKMSQLKQETTQTATIQNKLSSFFTAFKNKLTQAKGSISGIKNSFKQLPQITQKITNNIKNMGSGLKSGLKHVLKYAMALFSLRGIYSILSNSASSWLSSQNSEAQQLSANIEYLKNALGSVLAPILQFITNLAHQLLRAIQSLVYAFSGINIFAKATASSMKSASSSANKATKSLSGVHNEINNVSDNNDSSGSGSISPSMDLSQMENTPNNILDAIKKGNWYEVGATIGQKLNEAMDSIPWNKIQSKAKELANGIANFLNGFIANVDWNNVGNTLAQGLNTVIYFAYEFVTTFNWSEFGVALGESINGFFNNLDWAKIGQTFSEGIKGVLSYISSAIQEVDWKQIGEDLKTFFANIDWAGIAQKVFEALGSALGGLALFLIGLLGDAWEDIKEYFKTWIKNSEEQGGNIVDGILAGIINALINIGKWVYDNMIKPLVDAFCEMLGIHSPSTVFQKFGENIIQGLFNGISSLVGKITETWNNMKSKAVEIFSNIKTSVINKVSEIKTGISQKFQEAYNSIKNTFSNIGSFFSNIWRKSKKHIFKTWNQYRKCYIKFS